MRHLPHRPATLAIRRVELLRRKTGYCGPQGRGCLFDIADENREIGRRDGSREAEFADRKTRVGHYHFLELGFPEFMVKTEMIRSAPRLQKTYSAVSAHRTIQAPRTLRREKL